MVSKDTLQQALGSYCIVESNEEGELVIRTQTGVLLVIKEETPTTGSPLVVLEEPWNF